MILDFDSKRELLSGQFDMPNWILDSGLSRNELLQGVAKIEKSFKSKAIIKAKTLEFIANNARIAIDREDIFQDKIDGYGIMLEQRNRWENEVQNLYLKNETEENRTAWNEAGAYHGGSDFGHTSPNSRLLLSIGLSGLLNRIVKFSRAAGLSESQKEFYQSCEIAIKAISTVAKRLAAAVAPYNSEAAEALNNVADKAPRTTYEAMQLLILYFFMHEYVGGTRVRTLGRLDVLLFPFFERDIAEGRYEKGEIFRMLKFFLYKFWSAKVPYDLPFCLGGIDQNGDEVTNEISYMTVEAYNELNIYSPKIHIRVSDKTPERFIKQVLSCIRNGNSSFVFVNDAIAIKTLMKVGIEEKDARDYTPIGCYEPAVWGVEIGCTGNGGVNLAKAVELVFTNGVDLQSGFKCGKKTGAISSYAAFLEAVKEQITHMAHKSCDYTSAIERHYRKINPDPLLSMQYDMSVERGVDVYEGGAKYNNSSIYFYGIATLVDSLCAVKKLVFEEKRISFGELGEILIKNWSGNENLRTAALKLEEKYGNGNEVADTVAKELAAHCAEVTNNRPNGRGGVFKAALFSIDRHLFIGKHTMATPDGRLCGEPISKNMSATVGMDKNGITALIRSATKIDHSNFPTGSVLDVMLHPTAVARDSGLAAFYGILKTYMTLGGFAMHGNVFNASTLKLAQQNPEKYKNLQVRVCGWNAYFVNLSKAEQNAFIKQAEGAEP